MSVRRYVGRSLVAGLLILTGCAVSVLDADSPRLDLSISVAADRATATAGDTLTWTITVRNLGPVEATGVVARDSVLGGATYLSHSGIAGAYSSTGTAGVWNLGSLPAGSALSLSVRMTVNAAFIGSLVHHAGVTTSEQQDTVLTNNLRTTTLNVFPPVSPAVTGEPLFDPATQVLILRDQMDQYTSANAMWNDLVAGGPPRFRQQPFGEEPSRMILLEPGRSGSGKALRMAYTGAYQSSAGWDINFAPTTPDTTTHFFQYWARVTMSFPLGTGELPIKWFMGFHRSGLRIQWNTHNHLPCPEQLLNIHTYWQSSDTRETRCQANQPVGPYPIEVFDGTWHRFTYMYRPNTAVGARDGVARMWIDGVKVIDVSASSVGVRPAGGYKTWAEFDDLDQLDTQGIVLLRFGGTLTATVPPFNYDIDDFMWWRKN